jgi:hypothetical protein
LEAIPHLDRAVLAEIIMQALVVEVLHLMVVVVMEHFLQQTPHQVLVVLILSKPVWALVVERVEQYKHHPQTVAHYTAAVAVAAVDPLVMPVVLVDKAALLLCITQQLYQHQALTSYYSNYEPTRRF